MDRETDRHTERDTQKDKEREREIYRERERCEIDERGVNHFFQQLENREYEIDRKIKNCKGRTDGQTNRQTERHTEKQTDKPRE